MSRHSLALATLPALAAASDFAADPPPATDPLATKTDAPLPICRGGGARTLGTHMRTRRRCRTAEQWHAEDEAGSRLPVGMQVTTGQNDGRTVRTPQ